MKRTTRGYIRLSVFLLMLLPVCQQRTNDSYHETGNRKVIVHVEGVKGASGQIIGLLFSNSSGFPGNEDRAVRTKVVTNFTGSDPLKMTFSNVPAGTYAVSVLHDENGDRDMNRSFLGVPQEGYGMSGQTPISDGPPTFQESSFRLNRNVRTLTVQMVYLPG